MPGPYLDSGFLKGNEGHFGDNQTNFNVDCVFDNSIVLMLIFHGYDQDILVILWASVLRDRYTLRYLRLKCM